MNEKLILEIVRPHLKDGTITFYEFNILFSILSDEEKDDVLHILVRNNIEIIYEESLVISDEVDGNVDDENFSILYNDSIFQDKSSIHVEIINFNKEVKQSNEILCSLIQKGNKQAEQDLCVKNQGLVKKYVTAYSNKYRHMLDFEDLEQVGFIGLIKAAKRFDIKFGAAFSTYAVFWIKQAIIREIMTNGYAIRIPVHLMELINKITALENKLLGEGCSVDSRKYLIAEELEITVEKIEKCLFIRNNYIKYASLDVPIGEEQDSVLLDFIPDEAELLVDEIVENKLLREELLNVLSTLTKREEKILIMRYGLHDNKARTLEEIGKEFDLTRERIRQIEAKAIRKLRHPSRIYGIKEFI